MVSPFDVSGTLLVGGGLLVPCSLPGPPVIKQLMQMVTVVPGQGGRFQSVCFPLTHGLCNPMDCSTPGFPVLHYLLEFAQTQVSEAIQPSHPLSSPSPPALNFSQHQGLFQ